MADVQATPEVLSRTQLVESMPAATETRIRMSETELFGLGALSEEHSTEGSGGTTSPEGELMQVEEVAPVLDNDVAMEDTVGQEIAPLFFKEQVGDGKVRWGFPNTVSELQPRLQLINDGTVGGRLLKQVGMRLQSAYGKTEQLRTQRDAWERRTERETRRKEEAARKVDELQGLIDAGKAEITALQSKYEDTCKELQAKADKNAAQLMQHSVDVSRQHDAEYKRRLEAEKEATRLHSRLAAAEQEACSVEEEYSELGRELAGAREKSQQLQEELVEEKKKREARSGLQANLWEAREENRLLLLQSQKDRARASQTEREVEQLRQENELLAASADEARRRMDEQRRRTRQAVLEKEQAELQATKERKAVEEAKTHASQAEEAARKAEESSRLLEKKIGDENAKWIAQEQAELRRTFALQTANHERQMERLQVATKAARDEDTAVMAEEVRRVSALLKDSEQRLLQARQKEEQLKAKIKEMRRKAVEVDQDWAEDQRTYEKEHAELVEWGQKELAKLTEKANRQARMIQERDLKIAKLEKRPAFPQTTPPPPPVVAAAPATAPAVATATEMEFQGAPLDEILESQAQQVAELRGLVMQVLQGQERGPTTQQHHPVVPTPQPSAWGQERTLERQQQRQPQEQVPAVLRPTLPAAPITTTEAVAKAARSIRVEEFTRNTPITRWIEELKVEARGRDWVEMRPSIKKALGKERVEQIEAWSVTGTWPTSIEELEGRMRAILGPGDGAEQEKHFEQARQGGQTYTQFAARLVQLARLTSWTEATALRNIRKKFPKALQDKLYDCTGYMQLFPIVKKHDDVFTETPESQIQAVHGQERLRDVKCHQCGKLGHMAKHCRSTSKPASPGAESSTKGRCYKCGEQGHIASRCSLKEPVCYTCRQPGHRAGQCPTRGSAATPSTAQAQASIPLCMACGAEDHRVVNCEKFKRMQKNITKANKTQVRQVESRPSFPLGQEDQESQ
jgi:hypothetical protein